MSALFSFSESNGAAVGAGSATGAVGTTTTPARTDCNWKNSDDSITNLYSAVPISAGNNSYTKYQFGCFSGSFNSISSGLFQHVSGTFDAGLSLLFNSTSGYSSPSTSLFAGPYDLTKTGSISTGISFLFSSGKGPNNANFASTTVSGFSQFFVTQLATTIAAPAGDLSSLITMQISYLEN